MHCKILHKMYLLAHKIFNLEYFCNVKYTKIYCINLSLLFKYYRKMVMQI